MLSNRFRTQSFLLLFIAVASFFIIFALPKTASAADQCFCKRSEKMITCAGKWELEESITSESSCTFYCDESTKTKDKDGKWTPIHVESFFGERSALNFCTYSPQKNGFCESDTPDDSRCGNAYQCYCPFLAGESDRNNVSCAGRFFREGFLAVKGESTKESQCVTLCESKLQSSGTLSNSDIYLVSEFDEKSYRQACDYDRSNNTCSSSITSTFSSYSGGELTCQEDYCYCKYPSDYKTKACASKTTLVAGPLTKTTVGTDVGNDNVCQEICRSINLEYHGSFAAQNDSCDFNDARNKCTSPSNPKSSTCAGIQQKADDKQAAVAAGQTVIGAGSVVGLSLPLSDKSIPQIIQRIIQRIMQIVGALGLAGFFYGGVRYMIAAKSGKGEKEVSVAKNILVWSTMGLVIIFASYAVVGFIIQALAPGGN